MIITTTTTKSTSRAWTLTTNELPEDRLDIGANRTAYVITEQFRFSDEYHMDISHSDTMQLH